MNPRPSQPALERRQHRVYVTRNTEYHFRGRVCVAVRDRKTGRFFGAHLAVNRELSCAVRYQPSGTLMPIPELPEVGDALYFGSEGRELVTSLCSSIERPPKNVVATYPLASC